MLATTRHGRDVKWLAERKPPDFPILTPFHHPRAKLLLSRIAAARCTDPRCSLKTLATDHCVDQGSVARQEPRSPGTNLGQKAMANGSPPSRMAASFFPPDNSAPLQNLPGAEDNRNCTPKAVLITGQVSLHQAHYGPMWFSTHSLHRSSTMPMFLGVNLGSTQWHSSVCPQLDSMSSSADIRETALHDNLVHLEKRVVRPVVDAFLDHHAATGKEIPTALRSFCRHSAPRKLGINANTNVAYHSTSWNSSHLADSTSLVSVQKLFPSFAEKLGDWLKRNLKSTAVLSGSNLDDLRQTADTPGKLEPIGKDGDVGAWLKLASGRQGAVPSLVRRSLAESWADLLQEQLNDNIGTTPPVQQRLDWVGLWEEFEPHARKGVATWLELLGMGHHAYADEDTDLQSAEPAWFIVLKYSVADTSWLLRPTVLEAGVHPWYYPFRADFPATAGGKTVVFGESLRNRVAPLSEFVHTQKMIRSEEIWAIEPLGSLLERGAGLAELRGARVRHNYWTSNQA